MTVPVNTPSITAEKGRSWLLQIGSGTSPETYTNIAGLRANGISVNNNPVDITNKGSAGVRELLADGGIQQFTFNGSGLVDGSVASKFEALNLAAMNRTMTDFRLISGNGDKYTGSFVVSQFQRDGQYNDVETFSVTLESSGPVAFVAGP